MARLSIEDRIEQWESIRRRGFLRFFLVGLCSIGGISFLGFNAADMLGFPVFEGYNHSARVFSYFLMSIMGALLNSILAWLIGIANSMSRKMANAQQSASTDSGALDSNTPPIPKP